eukprot:COSAG02_NODE_2473_length_8740_cov_335.972688_2_plen_145_part_00
MKIKLRDDWSESPVQLESRGVRGAEQRTSGDTKTKVLFTANARDVAAAPAAQPVSGKPTARVHVRSPTPSSIERQNAADDMFRSHLGSHLAMVGSMPSADFSSAGVVGEAMLLNLTGPGEPVQRITGFRCVRSVCVITRPLSRS